MVIMEPNESLHDTVLAQEAIAALNIREEGIYLDATFGRGGHSREILKQLGQTGRLHVIDRDPEALKVAREWAAEDARIRVHAGTFAEVLSRLLREGIDIGFDGILFDLGVSSPQLDQHHRGFSFQYDGPLDMRMNPEEGDSAAEWLRYVDEKELADVLYHLGEERFSRRIARAIVERRAIKPFATTLDLADCITKAMPRKEHHKNPATRSFQAIRMAINDEIGQIQQGLLEAIKLLRVGGRLSVITFHSIEDRLVKQCIRYLGCPERFQGDDFPDAWLKTPLLTWQQVCLKAIGKFTLPGEEESVRNRRARSAKLRVAEKVG
jgi:16S rRNA (cytosine1402-N4)-methyltransferase